MPQPSPRFSVALCSFNGRAFIDAQIESIWAQRLPPAEIVAVDDGSTDGTWERLEELAAGSPVPMRVEQNPERLGSQLNFERAISLCEGDLIALSDQDDIWLPHKLQRLAKAFAEDCAVTAVFSDSELVDAQLRPLGQTMFEYLGVRERLGEIERDAGFDLLLSKATVTGATLAIRQDMVPRVLPMPPARPGLIHDRWIALTALATGRLAVIREPLVRYRQHAAQQIGTTAKRLSVREYFKRAARRNGWDLAGELALMKEFREWIVERTGDQLRPQFLTALDDRIRHFSLRLTLPPQRFSRIGLVAKELLSGGYRRFSGGLLSAAKDLVLR